MTNDPQKFLADIEDTKAMMDTGKMGYYVFQGAIEEGADEGEAYQVLLAYYTGMFVAAAQADKEEKDAETPPS